MSFVLKMEHIFEENLNASSCLKGRAKGSESSPCAQDREQQSFGDEALQKLHARMSEWKYRTVVIETPSSDRKIILEEILIEAS